MQIQKTMMRQRVPILVLKLAPHGPKADLVPPTTVGECISQEPALVPSWDAVTGSTIEYTDG